MGNGALLGHSAVLAQNRVMDRTRNPYLPIKGKSNVLDTCCPFSCTLPWVDGPEGLRTKVLPKASQKGKISSLIDTQVGLDKASAKSRIYQMLNKIHQLVNMSDPIAKHCWMWIRPSLLSFEAIASSAVVIRRQTLCSLREELPLLMIETVYG